MKKFLGFVICFLLLLPVLALPSFAAGSSDITTVSDPCPDLEMGGGVSLLSEADDVTAAYNQLYTGLKDYSDFTEKTAITVTVPSGFTADDMEKLYYNVTYEYPELFWFSSAVGFGCSGIYSDNGKQLYKYYPKFIAEFNTAEKLSAAKTDFDAALSNAMNECLPNGGASMTAVEKLLSVHDWVVAHCQYDQAVLNTGSISSYKIFTAYGALVDRDAVCQGYSLAVNLLLNGKAPASYVSYSVTSNSISHMWNIVKIGDSWYHMDATYDDPYSQLDGGSGDKYDLPGFADHKYFLLSDAELFSRQSARSDYSGRYGYKCSASYASSKPWTASATSFVYNSAKDNFITAASLYSESTYTNCKIETVSFAADGSASVSTLWQMNDIVFTAAFSSDFKKLYYITYSDNSTIYSLDIGSGSTAAVCSLTPAGSGRMGVKIENGRLYGWQNYAGTGSVSLDIRKTTSGPVAVTYTQGLDPSALSGMVLDLKNASSDALTVSCVVAYYSASGRMLGCESHDVALAANGSGSVTVTGSSSAAAARIMVIGASGGAPYSDSVYYG